MTFVICEYMLFLFVKILFIAIYITASLTRVSLDITDCIYYYISHIVMYLLSFDYFKCWLWIQVNLAQKLC